MIQGSLRDVALPDIFQVLVSGQKTGILTVVKGRYRARLYFELGRLQYAHVTPGAHLGEILVRLDLLTTLEVQEILLKQTSENAGTLLGVMAVHEGFISEEDLQGAIEEQILETLTELLLWRTGKFHFEERSANASQVPTEHTFDSMTVLMKVVQRVESWQSGELESEMVFEKAGDPTKVVLPEGGWEVLGHVDGRRSVLTIAAELDLSERQVYSILAFLKEHGIIRLSSIQVETPLVLVISESGALQRLVRLTLQRASFKVETRDSTSEGMAFIENDHPRAIVVDDEAGDGWEFVKDLRKLPGQGHLPVLILCDEAPRDGFFGRFSRPKASVLLKPFREIDLQQVTGKLVGRSFGRF